MDDLELQRLEAVADAVRTMYRAASTTSYYGIEANYSDSGYIVNVPRREWKALADALNVLDRGREMPETEYDNGPCATGESNPCDNNCVGWAYDDREGWDYHKEAAGVWYFSAPDVSDKGVACNPVIFGATRPETKPPIRIVPLKQGYLVVPNVFEGYADDDLAFTNAVDLADWLLEWLGLDEGLGDGYSQYAHCMDFPPKWWEVVRDHKKALDVAEAAHAIIKDVDPNRWGSDEYKRLAKAVKQWQGMS